MSDMVRKNLHIPDDVARLIGDVLHSARFRSETQAVIAMLEGASDRINEVNGYVYLMRCPERGLKIGVSVQPHSRSKMVKAELLHCIIGDRLSELAVHTIWGRYRLNGEWFEDRQEIVDWFKSHPLSEELDDVIDLIKSGTSCVPEAEWRSVADDADREELQTLSDAKSATSKAYQKAYLRIKNKCIQRLRRMKE